MKMSGPDANLTRLDKSRLRPARPSVFSDIDFVAGRKKRGFCAGCEATSAEARVRDRLPAMNALIFHMCRREEWDAARARGIYAGSSQDLQDGFIHFSTAEQLPESARRHRAGQAGLVLLAADPQLLGDALRWEPSRSGMLFPHVYGGLPVAAVRWTRDLPLGPDGVHVLPPLE
jgi:uncharacterized protein (DUF952 family)